MTNLKARKWIDVSVPLSSGMIHWPGDPKIEIKRAKSIGKGHSCNVSVLSMGAHSGTHMDAPLHFIRNGKGIDAMPVNATVGAARVIQIKDKESIKVKELLKHKIRRKERILFKTINSSSYWKEKKFVKEFVYVSKAAAKYLSDIGVQTVGIDYLSVGGFYRDGIETHEFLLKQGIWIIEGLNLSKIIQGRHDLICLPLKIVNADGAPARALLKPRR